MKATRNVKVISITALILCSLLIPTTLFAAIYYIDKSVFPFDSCN